MKQLTLRNLEAIAGGAGHYFTKTEDAVFGVHIPYPTAKGMKKFLDKSDHLAAIGGSIFGLAYDKIGVAEQKDNFKNAMIGAGVGVVAHMMLEENIDYIYDHFGLKAE